ncbi:MAG: serine O-acetyltransferase [Actinomycetota bacterium]|nr:serine O-acetyltransferase [Actinomycetota bacterium]
MTLWGLLRADAVALREHRHRFLPFVFPNYAAVVAYRFARSLRDHRLGIAARLVTMIAQSVTGAEIDPGARIGAGLSLAHTHGIVVGEGVQAGVRLRLYSGVVLGSTSNERRGWGHPTLGDDVVVWSKATVAGPISVGDRAQVGAHALVMRDVPADQFAVGYRV